MAEIHSHRPIFEIWIKLGDTPEPERLPSVFAGATQQAVACHNYGNALVRAPTLCRFAFRVEPSAMVDKALHDKGAHNDGGTTDNSSGHRCVSGVAA
jgi:hypothetical protein